MELVTSAEYVNPEYYVVTGTLTVDGGAPLDVDGTVFGGGSQRYIGPQYALPGPAHVKIMVEELRWHMRANQVEGQDPEDPSYVPAWHGYVTHLDDNAYRLYYQMRLERATTSGGRQPGTAASND